MTTIKELYKERDDEVKKFREKYEKDNALLLLPYAEHDLKTEKEYLEKLLNWSHQNEDIQKLIKNTKTRINYYKKRIEKLKEGSN